MSQRMIRLSNPRQFLQVGGFTLVEAEKTRDEVIQVIIKSALSLISL